DFLWTVARRRVSALSGSARLQPAASTGPFPVEPSIPSAYPSKSFHVQRTQGHPCTPRPSLYPSVGSAPPRILRKAVQLRFLVKRPRAAFARVFLHPGFTGNGSRGVPCRLRASFSVSQGGESKSALAPFHVQPRA